MRDQDITDRTSRSRPVDDVIRSAGEVDPVLADLGWDHEHYRSWVHTSLETLLLPPR
jgi:hypothetical protein